VEFLARAIKQEEVIKEIQIGNETVKVSLFADHMILYLNDQKNYPKTPRHQKELQQCRRIKINLQRSVAFPCTNNEQIEEEYMKTIPFTIASKKIKCLRVSLTKDVNYLYKENYKPLKKGIEEDYRMWRDLPCSWIRRINQHSKNAYSTKSNPYVQWNFLMELLSKSQ
jgi:hypothetical protein